MALNYLPIQATSVPCERAFSSSAETDTKKRNHIKYDFMEALQILKFGFKKERLNFTADLLTTLEDLTSVSPDIIAKDPLAEHLKEKGREATNNANAQ
jgi:hAT family C-terminal dimerisation region